MKAKGKLLFPLSILIFLGSVFLLQFCGEKEEQTEVEDLSFFEDEDFPEEKIELPEFVGSATCGDCHFAIYESFKKTGKGRAFHQPFKDDSLVDFSDIHVYDRFSNYHYTGYWDQDYFYVTEYRLDRNDTIHLLTRKVDFVIGSGNQTRSFLYQKNGYLFEIPITWYVNKKIWDLSPGYEEGANTRFDRAMGLQCINCHNSGFTFEDNSLNLFHNLGMEGIGCEKCHGPGGKHVAEMELPMKDRSDDPMIVNPAKLPLSLRFDVCRQCHLEGVTVEKEGKHFIDFVPGDPLNEYWEVFIPQSGASNDFGFASHVERLQQSQCFIHSDGSMNCTTCHDPHKPLPKNKAVFYQQKCMSCHEMEDCGAEHFDRDQVGDNCTSCHMPKGGTTDIPHVSSTDHHIRIVTEERSEDADEGIKDFALFSSSDADFRDKVMVNLEYYEKFAQDPAYLERVAQYVDSIEWINRLKYYYLSQESKIPQADINMDAQDIEDPYGAFYVAELRKRTGQPSLKYFKRARDLAPSNIDFIYRLAVEYMNRNDFDKAKYHFEDVLNRLPWHEKALVNYGYLLQGEGHYETALHITQRAIDYNPDYKLARENKVNILLNMGRKLEAKTELDVLIRMDPDNPNYQALRNTLLEAS